jgi:hypothetical protein
MLLISSLPSQPLN